MCLIALIAQSVFYAPFVVEKNDNIAVLEAVIIKLHLQERDCY